MTWWRSRRSFGATTANQSTDMYIITSPIHQLFVFVSVFPFTRKSKCPRPALEIGRFEGIDFLKRFASCCPPIAVVGAHTGQSAVCCVKTVSHAESNLLKVGGTDPQQASRFTRKLLPSSGSTGGPNSEQKEEEKRKARTPLLIERELNGSAAADRRQRSQNKSQNVDCYTYIISRSNVLAIATALAYSPSNSHLVTA